MRAHRYAGLLALALTACSGKAADGPVAEPSGQPLRDAYAACRAQADGDADALTACADAAIAQAGRGIDSPQAATAFRAALQELGDAAAQDGGQAAQVTFAHDAVRLARDRARLLASAPGRSEAKPAPTTDADAWARSRALSCSEHPVAQCASRYDQLLALVKRPPARKPAMSSSRPATPPAGLPLPSCQDVQAQGLVGGALADAFYARYPKALAGEDSVEAVALDPAGLENVVHYLVCVAGATEYDPVVAENGLALFASKRHGAAARASLDALSRSADPAATAARRFRQQIAGYLEGPGG